ncbi:MAG: hypothetical protein BWZ10_02035 [candidate division BRC1 bacterium ADurb.BinA364]|nr:MAG: hypothetical protein BWZ10_02035 [candidate division BRC1 bacterium ADurb.BinA364]
MRFVDGERLNRKRFLADAVSVAQGAIAAGLDDGLHSGFGGGLQEIIQPEQIGSHGGVGGQAVVGGLLALRRMIGRIGLGGDVLDGVDALDGAFAGFEIRQVALNPAQRGEFLGRRTARHQGQFIAVAQGADDKGSQFSAGARDKNFHRNAPRMEWKK